MFAKYVRPLLSAPGPEAWKQLLGGDPFVLFLDELPPYLEYAVAVPVGNADLSVVTTAALANLFIAVADMDNVCPSCRIRLAPISASARQAFKRP